MKTLVLALALAALTAGCAHSLGYAGQHPGYIKCSGKGSISGQGAGMAGAGLGGGEVNGFSLIADCGNGFEFRQGLSDPAPVPAR